MLTDRGTAGPGSGETCGTATWLDEEVRVVGFIGFGGGKGIIVRIERAQVMEEIVLMDFFQIAGTLFIGIPNTQIGAKGFLGYAPCSGVRGCGVGHSPVGCCYDNARFRIVGAGCDHCVPLPN